MHKECCNREVHKQRIFADQTNGLSLTENKTACLKAGFVFFHKALYNVDEETIGKPGLIITNKQLNAQNIRRSRVFEYPNVKLVAGNSAY